MACIIFDGKTFASAVENKLKERVFAGKSQGKLYYVKSFTFEEDEGSRLYTKLKSAAASRVGILYEPEEVSLLENTGSVIQKIRELSYDPRITGIMVQKPAKSVWADVTRSDPASFDGWWNEIVSSIDPKKDVDCLTPTSLDRINKNTALLPATVRACLSILAEAKKMLDVSDEEWKQKKVLVLGKSDIVGRPLTYMLRSMGHNVENVGRKELPHVNPKEFAIIISAAGSPNVVTGDMVMDGAVVIDVGSPSNDVDRSTVEKKASFLTPVPGGVGPVTVVSLMENIVAIA